MNTPAAAAARLALLRQEAGVGIGLNALLSIVFFLIFFGWNPVPKASLAMDFFPQTFGIAVFGTIVPSLMTRRKITRNAVLPGGPLPTLPVHLLRLLGIAALTTLIAGGAAAVVLTMIAPSVLHPATAMVIKAVYGGAVGIPLTIAILRSVLGMPLLPIGRAVAA